MDRAARKIIVENDGKHPASLTSLLYLREKGGRGLRSVEHKYKITKIKLLLKLYQNSDRTVEAVRIGRTCYGIRPPVACKENSKVR